MSIENVPYQHKNLRALKQRSFKTDITIFVIILAVGYLLYGRSRSALAERPIDHFLAKRQAQYEKGKERLLQVKAQQVAQGRLTKRQAEIIFLKEMVQLERSFSKDLLPCADDEECRKVAYQIFIRRAVASEQYRLLSRQGAHKTISPHKPASSRKAASHNNSHQPQKQVPSAGAHSHNRFDARHVPPDRRSYTKLPHLEEAPAHAKFDVIH